jgi:gliding motility-associated lipoprotein GldH
MPTDTLCIPIEVAHEATVGLLQQGAVYDATLAVRHTSLFPYRCLALRAELRYRDALGLDFRVGQPTVWELPLTDDDGVWLGGTWGSLIQQSGPLPSSLTFPYEGSYRLLLTPAYGDSLSLTGLSTLSLSLSFK